MYAERTWSPTRADANQPDMIYGVEMFPAFFSEKKIKPVKETGKDRHHIANAKAWVQDEVCSEDERCTREGK